MIYSGFGVSSVLFYHAVPDGVLKTGHPVLKTGHRNLNQILMFRRLRISDNRLYYIHTSMENQMNNATAAGLVFFFGTIVLMVPVWCAMFKQLRNR
jgi:hypothetical protein